MFEDELRDVIHKLSSDSVIKLKHLHQDDDTFGNTEVVISVENLDVRFIRDRGDVWSEILIPGQPAEWHFLDDMWSALQIPPCSHPANLIGSLEQTVSQIRSHLTQIAEAFSPQEIVATRQRVREVVNQRLFRTYGFIPKDK